MSPPAPWNRRAIASVRPMKILYLSPVVPHPLTDGGRQRLHQVLSALLDEHEVCFAGLAKRGEEHSDWPLRRRLAQEPLIVEFGKSVDRATSSVPVMAG